MKLPYSKYKIPELRLIISGHQEKILKEIEFLERHNKEHDYVTLHNIVKEIQHLHLCWYNVLFFDDALNEDIKNGNASDWLRDSYENIKKGEFEKTKDFVNEMENWRKQKPK